MWQAEEAKEMREVNTSLMHTSHTKMGFLITKLETRKRTFCRCLTFDILSHFFVHFSKILSHLEFLMEFKILRNQEIY